MDVKPSATGFALPNPQDLIATNVICRRFIKASLIYFLVSAILGTLMATRLVPVQFFPHAHLNLIGWVSMMIFGVAYKMLPTMFAAKQVVHSLSLARLHFWLANVGLIGMSVTFVCKDYCPVTWAGPLLLGIFALVELAGSAVFFYNIWMTFKVQQS
ncbi:MAG: cbb3-type cytochrome c oxidase subunit I [Nitrospirota bacterium]|nr:cbb3-type cytochrome c oxidase subunit I [Nitrospirota bacterium]